MAKFATSFTGWTPTVGRLLRPQLNPCRTNVTRKFSHTKALTGEAILEPG